MHALGRWLRTSKSAPLILFAVACGGASGTADRDQIGFAGDGDGDGDSGVVVGDGDAGQGDGDLGTGAMPPLGSGSVPGTGAVPGMSGGTTGAGAAPMGSGGTMGTPNGYLDGDPWDGYAWTTSGGMGTTVMPSDFSAVAGPPFCMSGVVGADVDFGGFAQLGINLNQGVDGGEPMTVTPTLSGVQVDVSNAGGSTLRLQIQGPNGATDADERWCADVGAPGGLIAWTDFNTECWDNGGTYYAGEPLVSAGILVPGDNMDDTPYDFCLNSIGEGGDPWGGSGSGGSGSGGAASGGASSGGAASGGSASGGAASGGAASGGSSSGGSSSGGTGSGGMASGGTGAGGTGSGGSGTGGSPGGGYYLDGDWGGYGWTAATPNSGITPSDFSAVDDLPFCANGTVGADASYNEVAMLGVNLNQAPGDMTPVGTIVPTMDGVEVFVSNPGATTLRLQVQTENGEVNADERWCVNIVGTGGYFAWSEFNTECWDGGGTAYAGQALESASILVPSESLADVDFDFCLEGLSQVDDPDGGGSGGSGSGGAASGGSSSGGASSGGTSSGGSASGGAASGGASSGGSGSGGTAPTYDGGYLESGTWGGYAWSDANGVGSSITPDDFSTDEDGLPFCVSGSVAPDVAFGNVAQLAWNVNQEKGLDPPVGSLVPALEGIDVAVTNTGGSPLRVQIVGVDPSPGNGVDDANRYCAPLDANGHIAWTEFNTECWDYTGDSYDTGAGPVEPIVSIAILVPGDDTDAVDFDFCLNQLDPADAGGSPPSGGTGFGFYPSTVSSSDAQSAYAAWKNDYLVDCGGGVYRVDSDTAGETVSEGIGYGMLIAVADFTSGQDSNNRAILDGLWAFYNQNLAAPVGGNPSTGLMNWRVQGCHGATLGANSATDAELDVAMALLMADARWPGNGYGALATAHIAKIKQHETVVEGGYALLKPGDQFGGQTCLNASYFAPGYYRAFADHTGDIFWDTLASDTYVILENHDNNSTGLVPNWADINGNTSSGGPSGCNWYSNADKYYYDAARTPWRIGLDYNWYGTAEADAYLDRVSAFVDGRGVGDLVDGYYLNGTNFGSWNNPVFTGAFGVGSMAYSQSLSNSLGTSLKNLVPTSYFASSLQVIYLQMLAGDFERP